MLHTNKKLFRGNETYHVISSDSPFLDWHTRSTTVPLKALYDQDLWYIHFLDFNIIFFFYCGFFIILTCGFLLQNNVANCQNYTFQARNWNYFLNNLSDKGLKGIFKPKQWIKAKHLKLYQQYSIVKQFIKFYYPLNNIWEPAWNVIYSVGLKTCSKITYLAAKAIFSVLFGSDPTFTKK